MIVKPKTRGFICTTAHPVGCAVNIARAAERVRGMTGPGPQSVLVIGASSGYGLASRITAAFGFGAATLGIFLERPSSGNRTATAGWYNNRALEELGHQAGLICPSINGDAFSEEVRTEAIETIRREMPGGQVDMVVYSLAAPKRTGPSGESWSSVLKPVGEAFRGKTVDFHSGEVSEVEIMPATNEEVDATVKVMGGEDWAGWMQALVEAGVLAENVVTLAYSYIGPELTHAIYKEGTIGRAKNDLEEKAREINTLLNGAGRAFISVNKALVTQASAAIPVVPLYISLLFRHMKEAGTHEDCTDQIARLFRERLYAPGIEGRWDKVVTDGEGRIRLDDWEMEPGIQKKISEEWQAVTAQTLPEMGDLAGYHRDFFQLFGFQVEGVDYGADVEI